MKIVCLCGSTRFYRQFQEANYLETMAGNIVLSVGFYPHSQDDAHGGDKHVTPEQKKKLDQLHFRKIDLAHEILVLNVGGYVGESTRNEIEYARQTGKRIRYLEGPAEDERAVLSDQELRARARALFIRLDKTVASEGDYDAALDAFREIYNRGRGRGAYEVRTLE